MAKEYVRVVQDMYEGSERVESECGFGCSNGWVFSRKDGLSVAPLHKHFLE